MKDSQPDVKPDGTSEVVGIVCLVGSIAIGRYSGEYLLIPAGFAFAAGAMGYRFASAAVKPMIPAFAVQVGHGLWMGIGLVIVGVVSLDILDVVLIAIGVSWLLFRPGLAPVLLLTAYQVAALVYNITIFSSAEFGSPLHKAMLVHVACRSLALYWMYSGFYDMKQATSMECAEANSESVA